MKNKLFIFTLSLMMLCAVSAHAQNITTIDGLGTVALPQHWNVIPTGDNSHIKLLATGPAVNDTEMPPTLSLLSYPDGDQTAQVIETEGIDKVMNDYIEGFREEFPDFTASQKAPLEIAGQKGFYILGQATVPDMGNTRIEQYIFTYKGNVLCMLFMSGPNSTDAQLFRQIAESFTITN